MSRMLQAMGMHCDLLVCSCFLFFLFLLLFNLLSSVLVRMFQCTCSHVSESILLYLNLIAQSYTLFKTGHALSGQS